MKKNKNCAPYLDVSILIHQANLTLDENILCNDREDGQWLT